MGQLSACCGGDRKEAQTQKERAKRECAKREREGVDHAGG